MSINNVAKNLKNLNEKIIAISKLRNSSLLNQVKTRL